MYQCLNLGWGYLKYALSQLSDLSFKGQYVNLSFILVDKSI